MTASQIIDSALELPVSERNRIISALSESVGHDQRPTCEERGPQLMGIMAEIHGVDSIPVKSRLAWVVWSRIIVSNQLRKEGYSLSEIGRAIGKDHCTVSYYLIKMDDALKNPVFYGLELKVYREFLQRLSVHGSNWER